MVTLLKDEEIGANNLSKVNRAQNELLISKNAYIALLFPVKS